MPNNIYHKRNANPGVAPTAAQLVVGEIALNTADGKAYTRKADGTVVELTEASVADGGALFSPRDISSLALWLDASDTSTLYQTDSGAADAVSNPTAISGCVGWWDASDASSYTVNNGQVSEWRDKTSSGGVFSQATNNNRPTLFRSSGDVQTTTPETINGVSAFYFDGVNDFLAGNTVTQDLLRNLAGYTAIAVCRFDSIAGSGAGPIWFGTSTNSDRFAPIFYGGTNTMSRGRRLDTDAASEAAIGSGATTSPCIMNFGLNFTSGRHVVRISGAEILNTAGSAALTTGLSGDTRAGNVNVGLRGSFGTYLMGAIGEIIIYNKALSTPEAVAVERYLAAKWGLTAVHVQTAAITTGNSVGAWRDKSGNNRTATQINAANRPTLSTVNGRPAVFFNGANSQALTTELFDAFGNSIGPYTIFGVANNTVGANDRALLGSISTGNFDVALYYNSVNTNTPVVNFYAMGNFRTHTSPVVAPNPAVFSFAVQRHTSTAANSTISTWQNGVRLHTLSSLGTYSAGSLRKFLETIGASRTSTGTYSAAITGHICELIVCSQALTDTQMIALAQYANSKWGATFASFPFVSNADAQDWINRVYQNNGTVSSSTAAAVNNFCNAIDAAGIRDRFYRLNLFCGSNLSACLVPLYRGPSLGGTQFGNATDTNSNFVATDYVERGASGGLNSGINLNKLLATGFDPVVAGMVHTDTHMAVYSRNGIIALNCGLGTTGVGSPTSSWFMPSFGAGGVIYYRSGGATNSGIEGATWATADRTGLIHVQRTGSAAKFYRNGADMNVAVNTTSSTSWTGNTPGQPYVFAHNNQGTANNFLGAALQAYSLGTSMTAEQAAAYSTAMQALQTTLGRQM